MQCSTFRACVTVRAEDISSLPLVLYRRTADGRERADYMPLYGILHDEPNSEMSAMQLRELWEQHICLYGNTYSVIQRNRSGDVIALWPLHPDSVKTKRKNKTGPVEYEWTRSELPPKTFNAKDILHIRAQVDETGITGRSAVDDAREAIGLALAIERFSAMFFSNGATFSGDFELPTSLGDVAFERLKKELLETHQGPSNQWKPLILEGGMKYTPRSATPEQSQMVELAEFTAIQIMRYLRVQPAIVQDHKRSSFSNVTEQVVSHVKFCLRPETIRIEQEINRKLLSPEDRKLYYPEHLFEGLLRGDQKTRGDWYALMLQNGVLSINEVRRLENLLPVEGGDEHQTQVNMAGVADPPTDEEGQDDENV